ncbi:MAG: TolB family protein [Chloroflexota bacterium]
MDLEHNSAGFGSYQRGGALLLGLAVLLAVAAFLFSEAPYPGAPAAVPSSTATATVVPITTAVVLSNATATPAPTPTGTPPPLTPTAVAPPSPTVAPSPTPAGPGALLLVRLAENGINDLFTMPLAAGVPSRLWPSAPDWRWAPAVSPDGQWLAYSSGRPERASVAVARRDGTEARIVLAAGDVNWGSPWWLPDGRLVAGGATSAGPELYVVAREGGAPLPLTALSGSVTGIGIPTAPRLGGALAFSGRVGGESRVLVLPAEEQVARFISPPGAQCYTPAYSPDGTQIAFSGTLADRRTGLFVIAPDGGGLRQVVVGDPKSWLCCPSWSPDGTSLSYVGDIGLGVDADHGNLFVVSTTGGAPRRLTTDGRTYHWRPAWLP